MSEFAGLPRLCQSCLQRSASGKRFAILSLVSQKLSGVTTDSGDFGQCALIQTRICPRQGRVEYGTLANVDPDLTSDSDSIPDSESFNLKSKLVATHVGLPPSHPC